MKPYKERGEQFNPDTDESFVVRLTLPKESKDKIKQWAENWGMTEGQYVSMVVYELLTDSK